MLVGVNLWLTISANKFQDQAYPPLAIRRIERFQLSGLMPSEPIPP
jgi:hypothetical protein